MSGRSWEKEREEAEQKCSFPGRTLMKRITLGNQFKFRAGHFSSAISPILCPKKIRYHVRVFYMYWVIIIPQSCFVCPTKRQCCFWSQLQLLDILFSERCLHQMALFATEEVSDNYSSLFNSLHVKLKVPKPDTLKPPVVNYTMVLIFRVSGQFTNLSAPFLFVI